MPSWHVWEHLDLSFTVYSCSTVFCDVGPWSPATLSPAILLLLEVSIEAFSFEDVECSFALIA